MSLVAILTRRGLLGCLLACAILCAALPNVVRAQEEKKRVTVKDLITFTWSVSPEDPFSKENTADKTPSFRPGETFFLTIFGKPKAGYHTYPLTKRTTTQSGGVSKFTYQPSDAVIPLWPVFESEPEFVDEGNDSPDINLEHDKPFFWVQEILIKPDAKPGMAHLNLRINLQVCNATHCTIGEYPLEITVNIAGDAVPLTPRIKESLKTDKMPEPEIEDPDPLKPVHKRPQKLGLCLFSGGVALTRTVQQELLTALKNPPKIERTQNPGIAAVAGSVALASKTPTQKNDILSTGPLDLGAVKKKDKKAAFQKTSLLEFTLSGVGFGLLSLLTPCVFPMIPITVSFFLKQSENKHNSPKLLALVYSGTIVTVLTIGGLTLAVLLAPVSQHWLTNLLLGLLFFFFALSLLGMFEIVLPRSLANFTSAREGRGGLAGTFFMALTFTIISFACVAPFYGSFLIFAASASTAAEWFKLLSGALAYSITFASPFFVLAMFPTLLRTLPRSGSWMNTLKVVMGFIEVAAAIKFLRSAELAYFRSSHYLTFDLAMGLYVALCMLCALYLLNFYRLPHDYEPLQSITVARALLAVVFLGLGLYLMPALFKQADGDSQQPGGETFAWIQSFLLPDENPSAPPAVARVNGSEQSPTSGAGPKEENKSPTPASGQKDENKLPSQQASGPEVQPAELSWSGKLQPSMQKAAAEKKLVFVDFTAIVCTNCRYNERTVFKRPEITDLFGKYILVKLYTDNIPEWMGSVDSAMQNRELQTKIFETTQLPFYVILKPRGNSFDVVEEYDEGKINSPSKFADFLKRNLPAK